MNVYRTRRSAAYPDFVYAAVIENAETAQLAEGNGGVRNSHVSSPFPRPKNGLEAIWNHILRWRGQRIERAEGSAAVTARGRYQVVLTLQDLAFAYGWPPASRQPGSFANVLFGIKGARGVAGAAHRSGHAGARDDRSDERSAQGVAVSAVVAPHVARTELRLRVARAIHRRAAYDRRFRSVFRTDRPIRLDARRKARDGHSVQRLSSAQRRSRGARHPRANTTSIRICCVTNCIASGSWRHD